MDTNTLIINQLISQMEDILDPVQLDALKNNAIIILYNYDIRQKDTGLIEYDDYDRFLVEQYYASLSVEGKSKKTIARYMSMIKTLSDWTQKPLKYMQTQDIIYFLAKYQKVRKVSNTTLDGMRKCICAFYSWAEFSGYIEKSPARRIKGIKHDTVKEPALTSGEIEKAMLHCDNDRNKAIISFMYETAARVSEVAAVSLSDINFQERTVVLHGKGNKDRIAMFTDKSALYLEEYLSHRQSFSNALFESSSGNPITDSCIQSMVRELGKKSGIDKLHPHRFRVSRITHLVDRGMPLQDVQVLAGHADISTTQSYYRNTIDNIKHSYRRAAQ